MRMCKAAFRKINKSSLPFAAARTPVASRLEKGSRTLIVQCMKALTKEGIMGRDCKDLIPLVLVPKFIPSRKIISFSATTKRLIGSSCFSGCHFGNVTNSPSTTLFQPFAQRSMMLAEKRRKSIKITSDDFEIPDLTAHRLKLLKSAAENLLKAGGYKLKAAEEDCWVRFTTKSSGHEESEMGAKVKVLCGPVVNSATKTKETQITPEEYRKLRLKDLEAMSGNKPSSDQLLDALADAVVTLSLLQVKSSQAVSLNLIPECSGPRESGSKGGAFLLYNSSRMAALRKKYDRRVVEGVYPRLSCPDEVDFGLLKETEEWALLFNFLMEYPSLIGRISKEMAAGKSNIHQLCDFLSKLCSLFSVYYRRVRVLLEPREHLLPTIQARLQLVMSVEQVLENGLAILNINKIEEM